MSCLTAKLWRSYFVLLVLLLFKKIKNRSNNHTKEGNTLAHNSVHVISSGFFRFEFSNNELEKYLYFLDVMISVRFALRKPWFFFFPETDC